MHDIFYIMPEYKLAHRHLPLLGILTFSELLCTSEKPQRVCNPEKLQVTFKEGSFVASCLIARILQRFLIDW